MPNHPSNQDIEEQDIVVPPEPTRRAEPITFVSSSGTPTEGDFRPTSFVFQNEEPEEIKDQDGQHLTEDGHGNMVGGGFRAVPHPSEPRIIRDYEEPEDPQQQLDLGQHGPSTPEPPKEPEIPSTPVPPEGPKQAPGIAVVKRDQQSDE